MKLLTIAATIAAIYMTISMAYDHNMNACFAWFILLIYDIRDLAKYFSKERAA